MIEKLVNTELVPFFKKKVEDIGFSSNAIARHVKRLRDLLGYMDDHKQISYTKEFGKQYLQDIENTGRYSLWLFHQCRASVNLLNLLMDDKDYSDLKKSNRKPVFVGKIGEVAQNFITNILIKEERLSARTIHPYEHHLSKLSQEVALVGEDLDNLSPKSVIDYVSSMQSTYSNAIHCVRRFLIYVYKEGYLERDLSLFLKTVKYTRPEKLPSTYTAQEIKQIEESIDRTGKRGKRDYAIILLASRLGLRVSDICALQFSNIDWENCVIQITQYKTGNPVTLPLLSDIGDALIDYIMHGRCKTQDKHIFFSCTTPYRVLTAPSISSIVAKVVKESGVNYKGKHRSAHSLRHSLATNMLEMGTPLPVISSTLGHSSTQSTMTYLGVDIGMLLTCSREVPEVSTSFYTQKGGILYE